MYGQLHFAFVYIFLFISTCRFISTNTCSNLTNTDFLYISLEIKLFFIVFISEFSLYFIGNKSFKHSLFVFYCVYIRIKVRHAYKLFPKLLLWSIIETWNYISDFIKFFCRPLSFTRDIKTCQVGNIMPTYKNGWQILQFTIILRIVFVTSSFQMITMFLANPYSLL